jgi:hypothetical protein
MCTNSLSFVYKLSMGAEGVYRRDWFYVSKDVS